MPIAGRAVPPERTRTPLGTRGWNGSFGLYSPRSLHRTECCIASSQRSRADGTLPVALRRNRLPLPDAERSAARRRMESSRRPELHPRTPGWRIRSPGHVPECDPLPKNNSSFRISRFSSREKSPERSEKGSASGSPLLPDPRGISVSAKPAADSPAGDSEFSPNKITAVVRRISAKNRKRRRWKSTEKPSFSSPERNRRFPEKQRSILQTANAISL